MRISRRSFLFASAPVLALGLRGTASGQTVVERGRFSSDDLPLAREQVLEFINTERAATGLNTLQLDELACRVAGEHALDMATHRFLSHSGSDGLKPYHRYSFAGGIDAVQENVSRADYIPSLTPHGVSEDLRDMHLAMFDELPPDDGHRQCILAPQHTHLGIGIALSGDSLRLVELFVGRYLQLDPVRRTAKGSASVHLSGKLLDARHFLHGVDVFFEALPTPPGIEWLRTPRPYSMPEDRVTLRPRAPTGTTYQDGSKGDYEWSRKGTFRVPVKLFKNAPGVYTIMFWIRRTPAEKAFPAGEICLRCNSGTSFDISTS